MANIDQVPRLEITDIGSGSSRVNITIYVAYETFERIAGTTYSVDIILKGKDYRFDDSLLQFGEHFVSNGNTHQEVEIEHRVPNSVLNEDIGRDEVYADITVSTGSFGGIRSHNHTNIIRRNF